MKQGRIEQQRRWRDYLILFLLTIVMLAVARATWGLYWKNQRALENLLSSSERLESLAERESVLRDKIERLKTPRGVEEEIRNNFPVVKEGEQVITIVEENHRATKTSSTTKSWWQVF